MGSNPAGHAIPFNALGGIIPSSWGGVWKFCLELRAAAVQSGSLATASRFAESAKRM